MRKSLVITQLQRAVPAAWDNLLVPAVFVAMVLIFYLLDARYLSSANVLNIMNQVSVLMVVTVAASLVIFTGGFDLSAGSVVALTGVVASLAIEHTDSVAAGLLAGIGAGTLVGAVNGFFVGYLGVSPLIVTLGTLNMARGLALILAGGSAIYNFPAWFTDLGTSRILGIPASVRRRARRFSDPCISCAIYDVRRQPVRHRRQHAGCASIRHQRPLRPLHNIRHCRMR